VYTQTDAVLEANRSSCRAIHLRTPDCDILRPLLRYLLTDPVSVGIVAWVGLTATIAGLSIAIWQIRLVRTAAEAATSAVQKLTAAMHSRERLLDLSGALRQLDSAKHHIVQSDFRTGVIFLEFARAQCVQVQELVPQNEAQNRQLYKVIVRITKLIDGVTVDHANGEQEETAVQRGMEVRGIIDALSATLAQLRYRFAEDGSEQ